MPPTITVKVVHPHTLSSVRYGRIESTHPILSYPTTTTTTTTTTTLLAKLGSLTSDANSRSLTDMNMNNSHSFRQAREMDSCIYSNKKKMQLYGGIYVAPPLIGSSSPVSAIPGEKGTFSHLKIN